MPSATQELARDTWRPYFDELSRILGTIEATVEVAGRDLGDQIAAEHLVLRGITYDDKDDVVVVALERGPEIDDVYEHLVSGPRRIYVATGDDTTPTTIDIEDAQGHQNLVRFERPEALPDLSSPA